MPNFHPYDHFGFLTHRVARLLDLGMMPSMQSRGYDFPNSCIGILADLWMKDGISQKELGLSLIKNKSSITKMLAALEQNGLIIKRIDKDDKRKHLIFLTSEGKRLKNHIEERSQELEREMLSEVPQQEVKIAKKVLKKFYKNLSRKLLNKYIND